MYMCHLRILVLTNALLKIIPFLLTLLKKKLRLALTYHSHRPPLSWSISLTSYNLIVKVKPRVHCWKSPHMPTNTAHSDLCGCSGPATPRSHGLSTARSRWRHTFYPSPTPTPAAHTAHTALSSLRCPWTALGSGRSPRSTKMAELRWRNTLKICLFCKICDKPDKIYKSYNFKNNYFYFSLQDMKN